MKLDKATAKKVFSTRLFEPLTTRETKVLRAMRPLGEALQRNQETIQILIAL